jgi:trimeric autotransporter adhesin
MAEISKQALQVANNTDFPNNNTGYITPAILRSFNTNFIDSTVNQTQYTSNSGSWNISIGNLNAFTASQQPSFTAINAFTASQLVINSGVNTFTQSANGRLTSLESETSNLEAFTSSINEIRDDGILQGYSTRLFFTGLVSASITPNVNGAIATITVEQDGTKLNTSSFNAATSSFASTGSFNAFTQSVNNSIASISAITSSLLTTSSFNTYTASNAASQSIYSSSVGNSIDTKLNTSSFNAYTQSVATSGFATTGSNVFTGNQILSDAAGNTFNLQSYSGSLVLTAKGIASGSGTLTSLTSSATQVNLIFKGAANTGEIVLSGSNNIFAFQNAATAGFRKYVTNANLGLSGASLPQFSSSMAFSPGVNSNLFVNQTGIPMTVRGPVSSSTYNISANALIGGTVNLGTSATLTFERAINGFTLGNNVINGTLNAIAYKTAFISSSAMSISSNNLGGSTTLNADSSSITLANNTIQNPALIVNNSYYNAAATGGSNALQITQGNGIFGTNTLIYASGSNTVTGSARQFNSNILAGSFNSASLHLNGDNSNMFATAIIGHNLVVTGSSTVQVGTNTRNNTYGSAFFGRHNAQDGNRAGTAETVFAIGTGTTTTPKTGFLIDSASNVYVEGTLNVSGAVYGNVVSASIASSTASIDLSKGSFFTLALVNGATTNINIINPQPGTTALIQITNTGITSASFSSNVKQSQFNTYIPTPSSSIDLLSLQSFDTTTVFVTKALNFT